MTEAPPVPDRMTRQVRLVLLVGMLLSVTVISFGVILYLISPEGWDEVPLSLGGIVSGLGSWNPIAWINLGIVLLIATPLTRVVASLLIFAMEGERRFAGVALLVLLVIGIAIILGG